MNNFDQNDLIFNITDRSVRYNPKKQLTKLGINSTNFSTHSFRKGAAHQAAKAKINDCQIKAMGRWLSNCYQTYTSVLMVEAG